MIKLVDILEIAESDYQKYKVHFATEETNKRIPYEKFLIGKFDEWQSFQTRKNFERDYVISLIYYEKDTWLFCGVYKVSHKNTQAKQRHNGKSCYHYDLSLVNSQKDLIGRVFINYNKNFRASYINLELAQDDGKRLADVICISSISDKKVTINDFDGFDNINIPYQTLKYIVENNIPSWKTALSNVKGVYIIVDTRTGKQYVGSAYGNECIWKRWSHYAKNGHGDNIELKQIIKINGDDYKNYFKYSILEVCNMNLGNEYIISRETYWKEVLMTRRFGLNKN